MSLPQALVDRFKVHLSEVRGDIVALEAGLAAGGGDREPLRAAAHKISGTAGAFGFDDLGDMAREVEKAVVDGVAWEPDLAGRVRLFVDALAAAAARSA